MKQILDKLALMDAEAKSLRSEMNNRFDLLEAKIDAYHVENIEADNRLMEAIKETNDRLDFQRSKIAKAEEELFVLKQKATQ